MITESFAIVSSIHPPPFSSTDRMIDDETKIILLPVTLWSPSTRIIENEER
jgi:hypothetical protein